MASRIDYSQNRQLYVGTVAEVTVADGNAIIDGNLGVGVTSFTAGIKFEVAGSIGADALSLFSGTTRYLSISTYSSAPFINTGTTGGTISIGENNS